MQSTSQRAEATVQLSEKDPSWVKKFYLEDESLSLAVHPNSESSLKVGLKLLYKALLSRRQQHHSCHHENTESQASISFITWKMFPMIWLYFTLFYCMSFSQCVHLKVRTKVLLMCHNNMTLFLPVNQRDGFFQVCHSTIWQVLRSWFHEVFQSERDGTIVQDILFSTFYALLCSLYWVKGFCLLHSL